MQKQHHQLGRNDMSVKPRRIREMKNLVLNSLIRLHKDEAGQGLVEYVLILALVAFAAVTGMNSLATGLNSAFLAVDSKLTSALG
jgi:Flp pilus assembly pilin Flp